MSNRKPVFVVLHGPSLSKITDGEWENLRSLDVVWASLNRFDILEDNLKIKFDMVWLSSDERSVQVTRKPNKLINHCHSMFGYGFSSLFAFLIYLMRSGYNSIYLFGADGGSPSGDVYFCQDKMKEDLEARRNSIWRDTLIMNDLFWRLVGYWGVGRKEDFKIYNVNRQSHIECFEKIHLSKVLLSHGLL